MQASFMESGKGRQKLLFLGHLFLKVRNNSGTTYVEVCHLLLDKVLLQFFE